MYKKLGSEFVYPEYALWNMSNSHFCRSSPWWDAWRISAVVTVVVEEAINVTTSLITTNTNTIVYHH